MEQAHGNAVSHATIAQLALGFVEGPISCHKSHIFVAVRVANHDFLQVMAPGDMGTITRYRPTISDNLVTGRQVSACFKEGYDVDTGIGQVGDSCFTSQQQHREHIRRTTCHTDNHGLDGAGGQLLVEGGNGTEGVDDFVGGFAIG